MPIRGRPSYLVNKTIRFSQCQKQYLSMFGLRKGKALQCCVFPTDSNTCVIFGLAVRMVLVHSTCFCTVGRAKFACRTIVGQNCFSRLAGRRFFCYSILGQKPVSVLFEIHECFYGTMRVGQFCYLIVFDYNGCSDASRLCKILPPISCLCYLIVGTKSGS